jgi:hypothetical protein
MNTELKSLNSIIRANVNKSSNKITNTDKKQIQEDSSVNSDSIEYTSSNIKINEVIYPAYDKVLYNRVVLYPNQMNNALYLNLKENLIKKVEKKCTKEGYIIKVHKILDYTNGVVEAENFTGIAVYNVKYLARICIALKETTIIAKITSYVSNANFAVADFGPIIKIIFTKNERDLNSKLFTIGNNKDIIHIQSQKKIGVNDYIKIQIKIVKFYQNDTIIKCMGYLENLPSVDEITEFAYKDEYQQNQINEQIHKNIYYNDDENHNDNNINNI